MIKEIDHNELYECANIIKGVFEKEITQEKNNCSKNNRLSTVLML